MFIDKEDMEEVWKQSWQIVHISLKIAPNIQLGVALKDVSTCIYTDLVVVNMLQMANIFITNCPNVHTRVRVPFF